MVRIAVVLLIGLAGCMRDTPPGRGDPGKERADCRVGSGSGSAVCDPGLLCLSNVCVRPPPADCQGLGETLASFDLGNYAEPEERAPLVAKYKLQCEQVYVTKEEGQCVAKARDMWAASQCAPQLFPVAAGGADCAKVREKIRASYTAAEVSSFKSDPKLSRWFDITMEIVQQSCEQDGWPDSVKQCIMVGPPGNSGTLQRCNQTMPPGLQKKLQDRMVAAMGKLTP